MVVAGAATGTAAADSHTGAESGDGIRNTVSLDLSERTEDEVSDQLFGRLCEHYESGTIYPGVYSEHVKNNSFYPRTWSEDDYFGPKTRFDPESIARHENVPFPWEPVDNSGVSFEQREGGVAAVDTTNYQRVSLEDARGGISQKIVLPDFRTLGYDLSFSVRGDGLESVTAAITTLDGETLATADVDVTDDWTRHELALELSEASGDQYVAGSVANVDTPYGEYVLEFTAEGSGHVDLDWITLGADDAINGKFNPSTVELMREQNTTWLKWPGGNFTSQYNWRDGIGPLDERPMRFNHAWGGVNPNYFGIDEYLELCEIADLTPRLTIGWWDNPGEWASERQILPEDAADWVEYCNGSTETEMGALRAENGHPEPYDVKHWEVGNEVWGPWQRGHTADPSEYASGSEERIGFNEYYDAMMAVDDSITVLADGMDPGYDEAETPDPDEWNGTLFEESGDRIDGLDLHRYNWGIEDQEARDAWFDENDADAIDYNEVLVMFPTQFGVLMDDLSAEAADAGIEDFRINVGEYGLFPSVNEGDPYPGPETMPGGSYIAGMLNSFIRQSETVVEASQTWVPVRMFPPEFTEAPPDPNPLAPAGSVFGLYSAVFETNAEWHAVDTEIDGDGRDIPDTGPRIDPMEDVPYVDAAAMQNKRGKELCVFLTNRNLREHGEVTIDLPEKYAGKSVAITRHRATASERPLPHDFQDSWEEPDVYAVDTAIESVDRDGSLTLEVGPASVVRLLVDNDHGRPATIGDDGVWSGLNGNECDRRPRK
ncbi:alpha-L-arabinofuranosidase domain protein (plasmid) [Haloterrigena turkmenica DSM 5511]|uniref:Alpha-L-arabinofuranosidase domain protein n=2 Tax=Haloterrigena turkmenica TaxID=62320 RepID=D2S1Q9_HALTV|nr:alpha-L-arabinofuranosidase domain protein [Haloterrigena turkmenica DSM 5511]